jgi:prepilin-type N-terminal cleavage/methylation domain-containing protein
MVMQRRRSAFSLIELLVVIAIISVLMGLLLPAVQKAREVAHRISCANNLKQIGLSMLNYELDYGALPPSRLENRSATWAVLLLPYMEQNNLFREWDLSRTYYEQTNVARLTPVKSYFCPSRRTSTTSPVASLSGDSPVENPYIHVPGALGDYAVVIDKSGHDAPAET